MSSPPSSSPFPPPSSSIAPLSVSCTPSFPSTLQFGQYPRRSTSERIPIPDFDGSSRSLPRPLQPPSVVEPQQTQEEEDEEEGGARGEPSSHASSSSSSHQPPTDQTDSSSDTPGDGTQSVKRSRSELTGGGGGTSRKRKTSTVTSVDDSNPSTKEVNLAGGVAESSESLEDDRRSSLKPNGTSVGGGRKRAVTFGGSASAHPLSPPLPPPPLPSSSSTQEPSDDSPFFQPQSTDSSPMRSTSSSQRRQHDTHPPSGHRTADNSTHTRPRRRSRPPPLQTHLLLSPSSSGTFLHPSPEIVLHTDESQPLNSARSSSSSSPLRNQHEPNRTSSPSRSSSQPHHNLLSPINDADDYDDPSASPPSTHQSLLSPSRSASGHGIHGRPPSRSVSHHSVASSSTSRLRRNSSSSSGYQMVRDSSISSRKGKEREREDAREKEKEREKKERKAAEKKERERERRYLEMKQEQVGRNDFGFGAAPSIPGVVGTGGVGNMLGFGAGSSDKSEARLEAFLDKIELRSALRSISTAAPNQPPSSPSLPPTTSSQQSTPSKPPRTASGSSPSKTDFPPTPTQTVFPIFRRQSTEGSLKSPAGHASGRTRTNSSLTLGGASMLKGASTAVASSLGGGKGGKEGGGGAEKLKKAFTFGSGRPSTERVPESVLTAEEKLQRMQAEFDAKVFRFESTLVSHPTAIANAQIYRTAMEDRYLPLLARLKADEPPLSILNVARWKEKTLEAQRRRRTWEQSRLSRSTTDGGDGWRSTESFGSPRGTPLSIGNGNHPLSRNASNGFLPRSSVAGPSMSTSSFEDGSVGGNLRSYKFGGEANSSTRRTSRSSNGMHPYHPTSLKKEKVFPWAVDASDIALFESSGGKVDEMLDIGGGRRSMEEYNALSRVGSALPSVQEVLDGQARSIQASSSTYGSPRSDKEPLLASPPSRRSLSPLPVHYPRPSSPLSNGQQQLHHFPNSGLSPPRPPSVARSHSYTRKGPSRTPLSSLITSPSQLQRPQLGEHTVSSPLALTPTLAMTPAVVNLNDRRGSLPEGSPNSPFNSTPRHNHHQSLSGMPPSSSSSRHLTLSQTQSLSGGRASTPNTPNPNGLSPPSASSSSRPTHARRQSDQPRTLLDQHPRMVLVPKGPYKSRATAKLKRLEDGLDSRSEDEYREEHLSERDVPGARSTQGSLSKRSVSVDGFHNPHPHPNHPHMGKLHPQSIKGRVTGIFTNSRDVSPQGSDAEDQQQQRPSSALGGGGGGDRDFAGWRIGGSGRTKGFVKKFTRAPFSSNSNSAFSRRMMMGGDLMEGMMTKGEESEQIEYLEREFGAGGGGEEMGYSSDTDAAITFDRRKDWELDRVRSRVEVEVEKEECRGKAEFLSTIRPSLNIFDSNLFESKQSFLSLHDQLNSYIQVTYDRFGIQLDNSPVPPQILQFEDLPPPTTVAAEPESEDTLYPLRTSNGTALDEADDSPSSSSRNPLRSRANSLAAAASSLRQRRRSSVSQASVQSLANLADHQAKAKARSREREGEEEEKKELSIEELEARLDVVRDGWDGLGKRIWVLAQGRAEAMGRYAKVKDPVMDLIAEREAKRQLLEPQSFTPVSIHTPRSEAIMGTISAFLLSTIGFLLKTGVEFGSRFFRAVFALLRYLFSPFTWPRRLLVWFFEPIVSPLTSGVRRGCHLAAGAVLVVLVTLLCVAGGEE